MKRAIQIQAPAAILRAEIEAWRTASRMSREAVAIAVVEAHEASGADAATEIRFDFAGSDSYDRAKKAAQKLFRWLDEGNLPANMIPSLLAALPQERRINCLCEMFRPLGIEARSSAATEPGELDVSSHLRSMIKESSEAQMALVGLGNHPGAPELRVALKEVREEREAAVSAERALEAALAEVEESGSVVPIRASK